MLPKRGRPAKEKSGPAEPKAKAKAAVVAEDLSPAKAKAKAMPRKPAEPSNPSPAKAKAKAKAKPGKVEVSAEPGAESPKQGRKRQRNGKKGDENGAASEPMPKKSRGEAVSFARRNPPDGERAHAEWTAIRAAFGKCLLHLKPRSKHEDELIISLSFWF